MLSMPTLDIAALEAAGFKIGPWPEAATGDFDGRLPPMMKLLLASDAAAAKAIASLGEDFEFMDVDPEDTKQLGACADLATAIKTMLADLSQRGPVAVRRADVSVARSELSPRQVDELVAGMSADTVRGAVAEWSPDVNAGNGAWSAYEGAGFMVQGSDSDRDYPDSQTLNPEPFLAPALGAQ